jgi:hypothetical protein
MTARPQTPAAPAAEPPTVVVAPISAAPGQPMAVVVQKMPDEKKDITGDLVAGCIGLGGALIGAVLGSVVAGWVSRKGRRQEERDKDHAAAFALAHKMTRIYSNLMQFKRGIESSIKYKNENGMPYLSLAHEEAGNDFGKIEFTVDEQYRAWRIGGDEAMNNFTVLDARYGATISARETYRRLRRGLLDELSGTVKDAENAVITVALTQEDLDRVAPKLVVADKLLVDTLKMIQGQTVDMFNALQVLQQARADYFRQKSKLILPNPDGDEVTLIFEPQPKPPSKK